MTRVAELHRRMVAGEGKEVALLLLGGLLLPLGCLYGLISWLRAALYQQGLLSCYRAPVPVISVGNLAVGGTGKTPMVDWLVGSLLRRGRKVAVVSRGYGGRGVADGVGVVSAGSGPMLPPEVCGDEPSLLARRNPGALVFIAPRRAAGVRLAVERYGAEVVILDDGFQHLAVARDLNVVLLDARRPLGNGRVLPAGLLREFPAALRRGDLLVLTRSDGSEAPLLPASGRVLRCRHAVSAEARSLAGEVVPLAQLAGRKGVAFAGIADPAGFFSALTASGLQLKAMVPLADHAEYDDPTLARLALAARDADFLVTTEKDGVKLRSEQFALPCFQVPMALEFFGEDTLHLERVLDTILAREMG